MTIRKLLTLTVCTALLGCSDDPEQTQQVPPTTGFGNRLSGLTAIIPEAGVTDKSSTTRTGAAETGATVWLVDDAITVTDGLHAGTFDVATGIGTATGKFNGSLDFEQTPLYAVYPAVSAMNGFTAPVVISTMQNARTAGANNIMTARCEKVKAASESQFVFRKKAATAQLSFDFTSEGKYASEKVNSVKITAEGVNFAGACDFDLTDPDAQLRGSSNSITYTFNEAPSLADKIEFTIGLAPCDLTQAANMYYLVSTDRYTFLFNKRPAQSSPEGSAISVSLPLDQFTATDSETPAEGEVKITHELPALNLSAQGTANCYIVDKEARCSFDATVMGNGGEGIIPGGGFTDYLGNPLTAPATIAPASAELLWETTDGLISELVLSDGIVSFNTSAGKGNALIAVKDQQGRIMWSWHIWCTDLPADQVYMANKYGNSYTFMDRSLGATSALDDTGSLGMSYQWGAQGPDPRLVEILRHDRTDPLRIRNQGERRRFRRIHRNDRQCDPESRNLPQGGGLAFRRTQQLPLGQSAGRGGADRDSSKVDLRPVSPRLQDSGQGCLLDLHENGRKHHRPSSTQRRKHKSDQTRMVSLLRSHGFGRAGMVPLQRVPLLQLRRTEPRFVLLLLDLGSLRRNEELLSGIQERLERGRSALHLPARKCPNNPLRQGITTGSIPCADRISAQGTNRQSKNLKNQTR